VDIELVGQIPGDDIAVRSSNGAYGEQEKLQAGYA